MSNKFIFYLLIHISFAYSGIANASLTEADSLFKQGKYTEAYEIYEEIYDNGKGSEAMLMKMAFIKEGLGNHVKAIILLDQYVELTGDKKALEKIRNIADEHNLAGYEYSDAKYLWQQFLKNKNHISAVLIAFLILSITIAYIRQKKGQTIIPSLIFGLILLVGVFIINNELFFPKMAIVIRNQSLLMTGPSAASDLAGIADKGHKVRVLSEDKNWIQIDWMGQPAFIRKSNLASI